MIGYSLPFGLLFGLLKGIELALVVGVGLGGILGLEYTHVTLGRARHQSHAHDQWVPFLFGFLRGVVFGLAGALLINPSLRAAFRSLERSWLDDSVCVRLSPSDAYLPHVKPQLRPRELIASAMRGTAAALAGMIAALVNGAFGFGLTFGIVAGTVSALVSVFSPFVEWWADNLPAPRLGALA